MTADGVVRSWDPEDPRDRDAVALLIADYLVATEQEKGGSVADAADLPERYAGEVGDVVAAFAGAVVLLATAGGRPVGCSVLTAARDGAGEIKRLWVDPAQRGHGHAGALVDALVRAASERGDRAVRLTVWSWRDGPRRLYRRLGFDDVPAWDSRDGLVCMERVLRAE